MADPEIGAAVPWLKRLGFREITIDGQSVFAWQA